MLASHTLLLESLLSKTFPNAMIQLDVKTTAPCVLVVVYGIVAVDLLYVLAVSRDLFVVEVSIPLIHVDGLLEGRGLGCKHVSAEPREEERH